MMNIANFKLLIIITLLGLGSLLIIDHLSTGFRVLNTSDLIAGALVENLNNLSTTLNLTCFPQKEQLVSQINKIEINRRFEFINSFNFSMSPSVNCTLMTIYNPYKLQMFKEMISSVIKVGCSIIIFNEFDDEESIVVSQIRLTMTVVNIVTMDMILSNNQSPLNIFSTSDVIIKKLPLITRIGSIILVSYKATYLCDESKLCHYYFCVDPKVRTKSREGEKTGIIKNSCHSKLVPQQTRGIDMLIFKSVNYTRSDLNIPFRGRKIDWYILGQLAKSNMVMDSTHCGLLIHKEHPSKHDKFVIESEQSMKPTELLKASCDDIMVPRLINEEGLYEITVNKI
jgi:hypothetical protein